MTQYEVLSIVLALFAIVLSTISGTYQLSENRRRLKIEFIFRSLSDSLSLRIINKGKNPIYVQGITIGFEGEGAAPLNSLFDGRITTFPLKLSSYDIWEEKLSTNFFSGFNEKKIINISIQDSEGKSYSKYTVYESNDKFGGYTKISHNNGTNKL